MKVEELISGRMYTGEESFPTITYSRFEDFTLTDYAKAKTLDRGKPWMFLGKTYFKVAHGTDYWVVNFLSENDIGWFGCLAEDSVRTFEEFKQ